MWNCNCNCKNESEHRVKVQDSASWIEYPLKKEDLVVPTFLLIVGVIATVLIGFFLKLFGY